MLEDSCLLMCVCMCVRVCDRVCACVRVVMRECMCAVLEIFVKVARTYWSENCISEYGLCMST